MTRFCPKIWLNEGFSGNTLIFFYFLLKIFSETRTKKGGFTCFLELKLETCGGFIETGGFWWSWRSYTRLGPRAGAEAGVERDKKYESVSTETLI